ncbi:PadR family transcriptional regulator [Methanoregula sp. UBA64]|jgi:DNA-binding PadR family transcriptional regulator|uniref:PadR family transcriptional regulator n=1 Tax=Methanoregula sp. UBA64 TaxID=1915554 RepID=UPI0025FF2BF2|nr:PadR family transcriptional regulator [Methanoregula sp. UBA64]
MTSLLQFATRKNERARSLLALYVIHSLSKGEKSGYDILKEIGELTEGSWVPSKGTLYPLLHQLEDEGQIVSVSETTGARARAVFTLTPVGKETLKRIHAHGREHHKKMAQYRQVITAIFGDSHPPELGLLFEIKMILDELPKEKKQKAAAILRRCRDELQGVI